MENKANYILLGIFVFVTFLSGIVFLLWYSNYSQSIQYSYYKVNIKESVSGLNLKAPVKLRGVNVGEVDKLYINPDNSEEVTIIVKIVSDTPIKVDNYAILKPQGITGLSYLEIEGGTNQSEKLKTSDKESLMGVIPAKASFLSMIDKSFETIAQRIDIFFKGQGMENLQILLENSAKTSQHLAKLSQVLEEESENISLLIKQSHNTAKELEIMSQSISQVVYEDTTVMMDNVTKAAQSVDNLMLKLEQKVDSGSFDIDEVIEYNLKPLANSISQLDELLIETKSLIINLEESPSDILFKSTPKKLGPGE
ncbi:MAG: MlaD family protein [Arcobacteraceae bacterium]|nr:MlaD family protein [Arcobacteraceae bacterium]